VLSYLRHAGIGFAVSADMSESLRTTIAALPEKAWRPLDSGREWAEVSFVPSVNSEPNRSPVSTETDHLIAPCWNCDSSCRRREVGSQSLCVYVVENIEFVSRVSDAPIAQIEHE
jgi:hypothetical protein